MVDWLTVVRLGDLHAARRRGEQDIRWVAGQLAARIRTNSYAPELADELEQLDDIADDEIKEHEEILIQHYDFVLRDLYDFGDEGHRIWFDSST